MDQLLKFNLKGFEYADLYDVDKLPELDREFMCFLSTCDTELAQSFKRFREQIPVNGESESELLIAVAEILEDFIAYMFGVTHECNEMGKHSGRSSLIWSFKNKFVKACLKSNQENIADTFHILDAQLSKLIGDVGREDREFAVAQFWREASDAEDDSGLKVLADWIRVADSSAEGRAVIQEWGSFRFPKRRDFADLVRTEFKESSVGHEVKISPNEIRKRDGFELTDQRYSRAEALDQVNYCKYCHTHEGDYCSKGFPGKSDGKKRSNPLGVSLDGCPLEEKISEANVLMRDGYFIGALAVIMIDNPMVPATGHRICNDCMKSCIYQKQDPVDVPQIESRILSDVLNLPWGYEIYFLLTRWNPLNKERPYTLPYQGINVLCVGAGPAGFNLSYHLLQDGFGVAAIDGLKIEPLPADLTGANGQIPHPVQDIEALRESLDERIMTGFGGVAEYGITVRWDKNFLKIIYLTLARYQHYRIYGGIRFGGTMTIEDAWNYGFDHIALAIGAGRPTIVPIKNHLARGIRQASDFLMALQLTGAAKRTSLANLQVRLPAVVVGGGLTAIDTATEVQAYYIRQVEKLLERYEILGSAALSHGLDEYEQLILEEFLAHGREVRQERERARLAGIEPDLSSLLDRWGGVTVAYRRRMKDSPAYLRNHEEIEKAFEEGIRYAEEINPREALVDNNGHVKAMVFELPSGESVEFPAQSVFMAAGGVPNTSYEREHEGTFEMEGRFYAAYEVSGIRAHGSDPEAVFTSYNKNGRRISFLGDNHPVFHGSVVRAMASGKTGARVIARLFKARLDKSVNDYEAGWVSLCNALDENLRARIVSVKRLAKHLASITVRAPQASRNWQPGQVYRLQNFESMALQGLGTTLQMEGMAVDGVEVDKSNGFISLLINEVGTSSRLAGLLSPGDPVVLMGPTGTPLPVPNRKKITVIGGHSAVTSTIDGSDSWKRTGNYVVLIAHFADRKRAEAVQSLVQTVADKIIWVLEHGEPLLEVSENEVCITGGMSTYLQMASTGGEGYEWVETTDQFIISDRPEFMNEIVQTFIGPLSTRLKSGVRGVAVVNSPMQCMLKEVCAQCLCQHRPDRVKGDQVKTVFSCFNQHQPLFDVDFDNLRLRQKQNTVHERMSALWLTHVQAQETIQRMP